MNKILEIIERLQKSEDPNDKILIEYIDALQRHRWLLEQAIGDHELMATLRISSTRNTEVREAFRDYIDRQQAIRAKRITLTYTDFPGFYDPPRLPILDEEKK